MTTKENFKKGVPKRYIEPLAEIFKILGDPTRIKILHLLMEGEMNVGEIAKTLSMEHSAISHQLRVLRGAQLVKFRKEGQVVFYSLLDSHIFILINEGLQHVAHD